MTSKRISRAAAALAFGLVLGACGDFGRGEPAPEGEPGSGAPANVTDTTGTGGGTGGFAPVLAVLQASCAGCHAASSATALRISGDADQDYGTVRNLVDTAEPAQSRLLQKAGGQVAHGGGAVLPPESEGYQTVLNWITAGAAR